jgi:hypothetical protein
MQEENKDLLNNMFKDKIVQSADFDPTVMDEIVVIVDRSGSMSSIRDDAEGGLNTFVNEQKKLENGAYLTIVEFDSRIDRVCDRVDINEAPEYTLIPRGGTALLDAIGFVISDSLKYKSKGKTIVVVVTDGGENSSKEWTRDGIFELMEERKKDGWEFMFLAANQNAIAVGNSYGFDPDATISFAPTKKGFHDVYAATASYTTTLRSSSKAAAVQGKMDFVNDNLDTLSDIGEVGDEGHTP